MSEPLNRLYAPLVWRRPAWLWTGLAWLLAGPLNLAVMLAIFLLGIRPMDAIAYVGLPCTILATLGAWHLSRKPVTHKRLFRAFIASAIAAPFLTSVAMLLNLSMPGQVGLTHSLQAVADRVMGSIIILPVAIWISLPIAGIVVTAVRFIAFRRERPPTPGASATQMPAAAGPFAP